MGGFQGREYKDHPGLDKCLERHRKLQGKGAEFWKRFAPWFAGLKEHEQDFLLDIMRIISKD